MYSRGAHVAVVVFDLTNPESFDDLEMWITQVRTEVSQSCAIVIAANKHDLQAKVDIAEIDSWARKQELEVIYVSAKLGEHISMLFDEVIDRLPAAAFQLNGDVEIEADKQASKKKGCC
jgi:Ras-related protein Rab-5C